MHWIVKDLFEEAEKKGLNFEEFSQLVVEATGKRIPPGTLRYWKADKSDPRIVEVEAMSDALGYELDLYLKDK